ncbi:MAG: hypothetical protein IJ774_14005 [Selenomonadaceae bacterium]|nr:hypothetical protein [Selenomonadaceae bacterium]
MTDAKNRRTGFTTLASIFFVREVDGVKISPTITHGGITYSLNAGMGEFMSRRNFDGSPSVKLSYMPIISAPVCVICSSC